MMKPKSVVVKNIWTDEYRTFVSIKQACYELNCSASTIYASSEGKGTIGGKWIVVNVG